MSKINFNQSMLSIININKYNRYNIVLKIILIYNSHSLSLGENQRYLNINFFDRFDRLESDSIQRFIKPL